MTSSPARSVTEQPIPGGWTHRELALGPHRLQIRLPAQPDEFLEQLEPATDAAQEADPYWAELWPACLPMARLVQQADWSPHQRALELGCGIGVVGLGGLLAGLEVTFSDRVELAVATAVENAHRNGYPQARGLVLDWAHPPRQQFPILLASDVLYDRQLHAPLHLAIESLLAEGGQCWIGDPGRSTALAFLDRMAAADFEVQVLDTEGGEANALEMGQFRLIVLRKPAERGMRCRQGDVMRRGS